MRHLIALALFLVCSLDASAQIVGANGMKKGSWRPKDVPEGWKIFNVGRYEFQSNAAEENVKKVATHLNSMFDLYLKTFPAGRTPTKTFVVKIFKNRKEFLDYGAPPGAGAYYSWTDKEMVGYDTGKIDGISTDSGTTGTKLPKKLEDRMNRHKMDMLGVFAHEGWHQYFHWWCTSKIPFPSWCDEGIGEYFYTARVRSGKTETGAPNDYRLGVIKSAVKQKKHIPLKELVTFDQRRYYAVANLAYAQGWSLVHFFLEHPEYKKQRFLQRFVKVFVEQHSIDEAVEQVFGKMNWEKTEADWLVWVENLKFPDGSKEEKGFEDALDELLQGGVEEQPAGTSEQPVPPPTPPPGGTPPAGGS